MRPAQGNEFPGKYRLWCHCPALLESHLQEYFSQFGNCVSDVYIPRDRQCVPCPALTTRIGVAMPFLAVKASTTT